jgi:hypothetical protein
MMSHAFDIGAEVRLVLTRYVDTSSADMWRVAQHMPPEGGMHQYRVTRLRDGQERMVNENQLILIAHSDQPEQLGQAEMTKQ